MYFKPFLSIIQSEQTSGTTAAAPSSTTISVFATQRHPRAPMITVRAVHRNRYSRGTERREQVHPLRFPVS